MAGLSRESLAAEAPAVASIAIFFDLKKQRCRKGTPALRAPCEKPFRLQRVQKRKT
jgi:hypothetical protein